MLWIADDVFTIHHGWLKEFSAEMGRRRIRIPFECISRADRVNPEVADTLAALGCFRIWIGSESGSQRILDAMQRGVTVEQVQSAIGLLKSRGIQTGMFLMWGYEGEEPADIDATVRHLRRTQPDVFLTTVAYPLAGTPYFGDVETRAVLPESWAQGSDRDIRIRGRHSRRYYAHADQLLKAEVEIEKLARAGNALSAEALAVQRRIETAREGMREAFAETEA
jgi:anaerobic magnesium-protoporphyrin IX monomethyl ester cyclase